MIKVVLVAILCLSVGGCSTVAYYAQAIDGHLSLMAQARPIDELVDDSATGPTLRQQLESARAIREFASHELMLPDNRNYRRYADLGRPFVVWNVFAAPEFSVELNTWCPLFVGCVNYRGYYDQDAAKRYAEALRATGVDIHVGGVPAYTTLGYFDDPLLNTFLRFGDQEVARIIFHELAHQIVYIKGDTAFNESFATAVENEGLRRWLAQTATPARLQNFEVFQQRKGQFIQLVSDTRESLRIVYGSSLPPEIKRRSKAETIETMMRNYAHLKTGWGGFAGFDSWFRQPMNNATLASVSLYTHWAPAFQALLDEEGGNLGHFYRRVAELGALPKSERDVVLQRLMVARSAATD